MPHYGENSAEATTLRRYRDEVLATTSAGRAAIDFYYRMSLRLEEPVVRKSKH